MSRFTNKGTKDEVFDTFLNGCCYWMAFILKTRFQLECPEIMYDPVYNHFGCEIKGRTYDITGDVTDDYQWESWDIYKWGDRAEARRIYRDCIEMR